MQSTIPKEHEVNEMGSSCYKMVPTEFEKSIVLLMDETHAKEDLVYDKHAGTLSCGYCSILNGVYYRLHYWIL